MVSKYTIWQPWFQAFQRTEQIKDKLSTYKGESSIEKLRNIHGQHSLVLLRKKYKIELGRARFFRVRVGLGLYTLSSGFLGGWKNLLTKLGFSWDWAWALLHK
jgi:hypothetical protein